MHFDSTFFTEKNQKHELVWSALGRSGTVTVRLLAVADGVKKQTFNE